MKVICVIALFAMLTHTALAGTQEKHMDTEQRDKTGSTEQATFGAGCFWCVEAVFKRIPGVISVKPGYMGGHMDNPTYRQVSSGSTGHAEIIMIEYDPGNISYEKLLEVFWKSHDPTQLNRQGADVGTQYRSAIFYHTPEQRETAEKSKQALEKEKRFSSPIVTEIAPASDFYVAEDDHHEYYRNNPDTPYSRFVIQPKLEKLGLE